MCNEIINRLGILKIPERENAMGKITTTNNMNVFINNMIFSATRPTPPDEELLSVLRYGAKCSYTVLIVSSINYFIDVLHTNNVLVSVKPIYEFDFLNDFDGFCEFICSHDGLINDYRGEGDPSHNYSWYRKSSKDLATKVTEYDRQGRHYYVIDRESLILYDIDM